MLAMHPDIENLCTFALKVAFRHDQVEIQEDFQTQEDTFDRISKNAHMDEERGTWPPRLARVQVRGQSGPKVRGNSMYRVTKNPRSQGVLVAGRNLDSIPTLRAEAHVCG